MMMDWQRKKKEREKEQEERKEKGWLEYHKLPKVMVVL